MKLLMRQFEFERKSGDHLVCWVEDDERLRIGAKLTLEATGDEPWFVKWRGTMTSDKQSLHKPWKVGGLA